MRIIKVLRNRLRWWLSPRFPQFYSSFYRFVAPGRNNGFVVDRGTEIVIEGYPSSANTYAWITFLESQHREVRVAHHLHLPSQILEGVRRKIPVLVLIRNSFDAARSLCVRLSKAAPEGTIKNWIEIIQ